MRHDDRELFFNILEALKESRLCGCHSPVSDDKSGRFFGQRGGTTKIGFSFSHG